MDDSAAEDTRIPTRKVSSLTQFCQRALIANIDAISSLGENISLRLVRPILVACNADTLARLEDETPSLAQHTEDLWKDLCGKSYPVITQQMQNSHEEPDSWRDCLFRLREEEARRLEQTANRLRLQRLEDEQRKRKRQVKLTDQLPKVKRPRRGWSSGLAPPKSLFEKTRKEATKLQKTVFGSRIVPPRPWPSTEGLRPSASTSQLVPKTTEPAAITTVTVRTSKPPSDINSKVKSRQSTCPQTPRQNTLHSGKKPLTTSSVACKSDPSSKSVLKSSPSPFLKPSSSPFLKQSPSPFLKSSSSSLLTSSSKSKTHS